MIGTWGLPEVLILLVVAVIVVWPASRVCAKAGYSPWLGVAAVIPVVNVLLLWFPALAEWPSRRGA
jgi:energy-converting hydrogenase Eha subunit B